MPLATVHLLSLTQSTTIPSFLKAIHTTNVKPLVISKVIRWIITPSHIDVKPLLRPSKPWDLLLITLDADPLPSTLTNLLETTWSTSVGIPSRLTNSFTATNAKLLHPDLKSIPPLTGALNQPRLGSSSQTLELSSDLYSWIKDFAVSHTGRNAVSMLNLLAFKPGMHESYLTYGKAFAESIGAKRGGNAKLVGNVVPQSPSPAEKGVDEDKWNEFALAHYPSILHFADMLASEDYQAVNLKHRVPALEDTCILCTSEIDIEEILKGNERMGIGQRAMERREVKL